MVENPCGTSSDHPTTYTANDDNNLRPWFKDKEWPMVLVFELYPALLAKMCVVFLPRTDTIKVSIGTMIIYQILNLVRHL